MGEGGVTSGGVSLGISLRIRTHLFSGTALTFSMASSNWRLWDSGHSMGGGGEETQGREGETGGEEGERKERGRREERQGRHRERERGRE